MQREYHSAPFLQEEGNFKSRQGSSERAGSDWEPWLSGHRPLSQEFSVAPSCAQLLPSVRGQLRGQGNIRERRKHSQ